MTIMAYTDDRPVGVAEMYSAHPNAWAGIQTYARLRADDPPDAVGRAFREYGVVRITGVFADDEIGRWLDAVKRAAGIDDRDFPAIARGERNHFVHPGGLGHYPALWETVVHPGVRRALAAVFDGPVHLATTSVSAGFSSPSLHRDGAYRADRVLLQVLIHLGEPGRARNSLGFVPFTHDPQSYDRKAREAGISHPPEHYLGHHALKRRCLETGDLTELLDLERHVMQVDADPGDLVLFDPRLLHTGTRLAQPKYMIINTMGLESAFDADTVLRSHDRPPPHDFDFPHAFVAFLRSHGLMSPAAERALEELDRTILRYPADVDPAAPVYIYGAGSSGEKLRAVLAEAGVGAVAGFIDTHRSGVVGDVRCYSLEEYRAVHRPENTILIASVHHAEIRRNLEAAGIAGARDASRFALRRGQAYVF